MFLFTFRPCASCHMSAGINSSTFCGVLRCARTATCVNSSPCARGAIAARYLWSGNSHKATHFPVALVRQRPGHFNPSVLRINLMFLDSLAQSKRARWYSLSTAEGTVWSKGWSSEEKACQFRNMQNIDSYKKKREIRFFFGVLNHLKQYNEAIDVGVSQGLLRKHQVSPRL